MAEYEDKHEDKTDRPQEAADNQEHWARDLIGRVAFTALLEQRRARRWGIFFKLLLFIYLFALLFVYFVPDDWQGLIKMGGPHTALVSVDGLIAPGTEASAENVLTGLRDALEDGNTAGVILEINSPGGSPVQAGVMYDEIMRLRKAHPDTPIFAVITDAGASGGYYVASAAEKIYANRASIIGSIGVIAGGFGFVDTLEKLGVERRLYTAGENKDFLDPFSPVESEHVRHLQDMLQNIHQQFITAVREGRGDRLKETPEMFSGLVWTGDKSLELGLIDGLATPRHVAKEIIGAEKTVDYTRRPPLLERFFTGVESGVSRLLARGFSVESSLR